MEKKIIAYIGVGIIIVFLILGSFNIINFKSIGRGSSVSGDYSNLPEECRKPEGQDIESWKEHLGHHQNTLYCLDYFKN